MAENIEVKENEQRSDIETKALKMGWTPKDDFKGDLDKWRTAEEFVERGENYLPILKKRYDKLESDNAEIKQTLKQFADHYKGISEREYKRAVRDLQGQKDSAIELGDKEKVKEIDADLAELQTLKTTAPASETANWQEADQRHYQAWVKENGWFETDSELQAYAVAQSNYVQKTKPGLLGTADFYAEVKKRVEKEFPDKFTNPRRNEPGAVHGADDTKGGGKKGGKGYHDLPAEARSACDRFVKDIPGFKREDYLSTYDWD